uniref:DUF223 domain-containing protein n=1 Tax=Chenopodium quinoa TaxID=63459 RepID=A0A803KUA6_CHEQI
MFRPITFRPLILQRVYLSNVVNTAINTTNTSVVVPSAATVHDVSATDVVGTATKPQYQSIASIPKLEIADGRYDVLGVILFVEEAARHINSRYNTQGYVREIVITDQTHNQPLTISAWNDLSGTASDALNFWAERFTVVEFTALKQNPRRAFALSTTMSTRIIHDPKGDRANMLREWVAFKFEAVDDDVVTFQEIEEKLRKKSTFFNLGPSNSLGSSGVLEWSLKAIGTDEDVSKKDPTKVTVGKNNEIEYSNLNKGEEFTPTEHQESSAVDIVELNVESTHDKTPTLEGKDKGKNKISEIHFPQTPMSSKGIIISDGSRNDAIDNVEIVNTSKISTVEWTELCRTRMSGTKHSPVTPSPIGDTKSSLDCAKSTAPKILRFTTAEQSANEGNEAATKDPKQ